MFFGLDRYITEKVTAFDRRSLAQEVSAMRYSLIHDQLFVRRLLDIVIASLLVVLTLPTMIVIAIAIKLDSPGTVLFKQTRINANGKLFTIYTFRSMLTDADALHTKVVIHSKRAARKASADLRVTRVGQFIRETSLETLPQLFNVLKGDMSLMGPRPALPWLVGQQYGA
jgi:lipopolysaccharide/colanic/teichoic acid biosynthesis glycosyltransferase